MKASLVLAVPPGWAVVDRAHRTVATDDGWWYHGETALT
jgi:hypothetical protein